MISDIFLHKPPSRIDTESQFRYLGRHAGQWILLLSLNAERSHQRGYQPAGSPARQPALPSIPPENLAVQAI